MQPDPSDVHQTLEYRVDAELADWLPIGLLTIFCGLFLFAVEMPDWPPPKTAVGAAAAIPAGIWIAALALRRRFRRGKPVYRLSPQGISIGRWRARDIFIPWCEVKGVDTIDIVLWHWLAYRPHTMHCKGVTVALVSRKFYDQHIHINSYFMRGPYWYEVSFIPKGDLVQCALHPEIVSVEAKALRAAVETRWHAFRDRPPAKPAGSSVPSVTTAWKRPSATVVPGARVVAAGDKPRPITWWQGIKIALPLIGIIVAGSNLAGLWATEAQTKALKEKREWEESNARYHAERKALHEKLRKEREAIDEYWKRNY